MKVRFVVNPCSGRNRRRPWLAQSIAAFAAANGIEGDVVVTEGPGHATELARAAAVRGCTVVAAVGGDGTMNEVAQGLVGSPTALALVPCGSGNGLALYLRMPRSLHGALELIRDGGRVMPIDTGWAGERPFFNAMGVGFDAEISRRFNRLTRRGLPAYIRTGFAALRALKPERFTIISTDAHTTVDALLVAVANSDQYGNNARIAPGARVNDGLLDLIVVKPANLIRLALLVPRLFLGNLDRSRQVLRMRGSGFQIHRAAAGVIHTDGETHHAGTHVAVRSLPLSLRVLVPANSRVAAVAPSAARLALQSP